MRKIRDKTIRNKNELFLSFLSHQERLGFVSWRSGAFFCSEDFSFPKSLGGENLSGPSRGWVPRLGQGEAKLPSLAKPCFGGWREGHGRGFVGSRDLQPCPCTTQEMVG